MDDFTALAAGRLDLPRAVPKPCNDCPWRLSAVPGWLGPHSPEDWINIVHGESPIACHQTIPEGTNELTIVEAWRQEGIRQCAGAAMYRVNVCKSPRNPADAEHSIDVDHPLLKTIFGTDAEFLAHHRNPRGRPIR